LTDFIIREVQFIMMIHELDLSRRQQEHPRTRPLGKKINDTRSRLYQVFSRQENKE